MKAIDVTDATGPLADYALRAAKEVVIVTSAGKPVAAVVPVGGADLETVALSTNPRFLAILERSRVRHESEGGISPDELRRQLGLKPNGRRPSPKRTKAKRAKRASQ